MDAADTGRQSHRELLALREENRAKFLKFWSPGFQSIEVISFWLQASADGDHLAMYFRMKDGSEAKVTLHQIWLGRFGNEMRLAFGRMTLLHTASDGDERLQ
jgi:hypothetical protein